MKNYRSRKHCLLLYPEDSTHIQAIEKIKSNYEYALIVHDKDVDEDGNLKKAHFHVILEFSYAKWQHALADDLGITSNYIQQCRNFENALEYLIHYNDENKFQYEIENVTGTLKTKLIKSLKNNSLTEEERVIDLFDFIENSKRPISVTEFARYCSSVGKWDIFRRSSLIFIKMIEEHNVSFTP